MSQRPPPTVILRWWQAPEFTRSLPLFVLSAVFFIAGAGLRFAYPTYALYGPGVFTFWALLLALGFTCAIGGVVSWTLGTDAAPAPVGTPDAPTTPEYLPIEFPEPARIAEEPEPAPPVRSRGEFGRPTPDIRPTGASGEWYEGPNDSERFDGPEYVLPIDVQPVAEAAPIDPTAESEPVENVLADLERIERDLAPRARVVDPSPG
jgi:hypothetical protein